MQQMAIGQLYLLYIIYLQRKNFRHSLDSRVSGIETRFQVLTVSRESNTDRQPESRLLPQIWRTFWKKKKKLKFKRNVYPVQTIYLYPSGDHKYYLFFNFYPEDGGSTLLRNGGNYYHSTERHLTKALTLRRLMSYIYIYIHIYIYGAPILDVSRSHTTTQHSR